MGKNNNLNEFEYSRIPKPNLIKELPNGSHIYGLAFEKGMKVPSHTGPGDAYLMVSEGKCRMTFEGTEVVDLETGDLFHFDANRVHDLEAIENFKAIVITTFPFAAVNMEQR